MPPGIGQTFQPGGDVDPIPVEPFAFDDHIAQVDADAKLHLPMFRQLGVLHFEFVLNLDRAAHGIDHTGELGQQIITGRIDHAATVLLDQRGDQCTIGGEGADGGFFIVPHEAAVAGDIGAEDRRQLALHADWASGQASLLLSAGDYPADSLPLSMRKIFAESGLLAHADSEILRGVSRTEYPMSRIVVISGTEGERRINYSVLTPREIDRRLSAYQRQHGTFVSSFIATTANLARPKTLWSSSTGSRC